MKSISYVHHFTTLTVSVNPNHVSLFTPLTFYAGDITLRNRLVLAPMTTWSSHDDGTINPDELEFLRRRARGVGMAMTAACYVQPQGKAFDGQWSCATDDMIPSLRAAAEAIKSQGAVAVLQLHHGGRMSPSRLIGGQPVSASAVPAERSGAETPRAMTDQEIEETIEAFGAAAKRAIRAGFNGVEIHGANTYLLQQFFSPHSNRRQDLWGGAVENRAAFPIAVLEEVQEVVRRNAYFPFAIGYRLSPEELEVPGITMEETLELVEGIAACRPDWIHVSTGNFFAGSIRRSRDKRPRVALIAEKVRNRTVIIGSGSITTPDLAVQALEQGADLLALGRPLIVDPEWPQKVLEGRADEILPCLPPRDADHSRSIPFPLYSRILSRTNWMPVCDETENVAGSVE